MDENDTQPIYAALDLGTNNCRLLMAVPVGSGFRVVEAFSRASRLGEGLDASGSLAEPAIERTLSALAQCHQRIERRRVRRLRSVATEACRQAANRSEFLDRARTEAGIEIEVISAEEEARLTTAGCLPLLYRHPEHTLLFDIGGGSTELVLLRPILSDPCGFDPVEAMASIPLGVVTLAERHGLLLQSPDGFAKAVDEVAALLNQFEARERVLELAGSGKLRMLGTSGTVTTLAGVHLGLPRYDRRMVDGIELECCAIAAASRRLILASATERAALPCVGADRADLMLAGCAILEAIMRSWPVGRLTVADRGVREGVLLAMMRADRMAKS
jgi:exopolyphosphatase/guanosine-5'-triphosphate,3'-diphosphate pyrophosphatase